GAAADDGGLLSGRLCGGGQRHLGEGRGSGGGTGPFQELAARQPGAVLVAVLWVVHRERPSLGWFGMASGEARRVTRRVRPRGAIERRQEEAHKDFVRRENAFSQTGAYQSCRPLGGSLTRPSRRMCCSSSAASRAGKSGLPASGASRRYHSISPI